jgi:hypothetical protein
MTMRQDRSAESDERWRINAADDLDSRRRQCDVRQRRAFHSSQTNPGLVAQTPRSQQNRDKVSLQKRESNAAKSPESRDKVATKFHFRSATQCPGIGMSMPT